MVLQAHFGRSREVPEFERDYQSREEQSKGRP
jgi:hypothetical protein